jgi:hypothetical protein
MCDTSWNFLAWEAIDFCDFSLVPSKTSFM